MKTSTDHLQTQLMIMMLNQGTKDERTTLAEMRFITAALAPTPG
jgi:hypothetical protein